MTIPLPVPDFVTVRLNWGGGGTWTVKFVEEVAVPPGVVTLNGPVVAAVGTAV